MGESLRVVGVGSPHGDDRVGWWLAERLAGRAGSGVEVVRASSPLDLLDDLEGVGTLIVADALRGGGGPRGSVVIRRWADEIGFSAGRDGSTHGLGVVEALRLAVALGRLPKRVILFGVEAGDCEVSVEGVVDVASECGDDWSGPVRPDTGGAAPMWAEALDRLERVVTRVARRREGRQGDE